MNAYFILFILINICPIYAMKAFSNDLYKKIIHTYLDLTPQAAELVINAGKIKDTSWSPNKPLTLYALCIKNPITFKANLNSAISSPVLPLSNSLIMSPDFKALLRHLYTTKRFLKADKKPLGYVYYPTRDEYKQIMALPDKYLAPVLHVIKGNQITYINIKPTIKEQLSYIYGNKDLLCFASTGLLTSCFLLYIQSTSLQENLPYSSLIPFVGATTSLCLTLIGYGEKLYTKYKSLKEKEDLTEQL